MRNFRILFLTVVLCAACQRTVKVEPVADAAPKQDLLKAQEISVRQEMESIESFVQRSGWNMKETGTGLRYEIYKPAPGNAPAVEYGNAVKVSYRLQLLNGTLAEEYTAENPRTFILGKSEMPSGLAEALLLLHKGDKARLVIPSHLAYGFSGNGSTIPPGASLLYHLCVEDVLIPRKN